MDPFITSTLLPMLGSGAVTVAIVTGWFRIREKREESRNSERTALLTSYSELITGLRAEIGGVREQWAAEQERRATESAELRREWRRAERRAERAIAYIDAYRAWYASGAVPPPPSASSLWEEDHNAPTGST